MNKKYAVISNKLIPKSFETSLELTQKLKDKGINVISSDITKLIQNVDFAFIVGGDGTLIKAAKFYSLSKTPVLGINLGRLGFLAQSKENELDNTIEKVLNNKCHYENRLMITTNGKTALNDIVIKGNSTSRTARFYLHINDDFVCDYIADGIIVSTPTGSTAYGLSAGGPVITPQLDALVIVPICPHTLTARPLVVPASENLTISTTQECEDFIISIDGEPSTPAKNKINIKKSEHSAKLALLDNDAFYSVIRNKLNWGVSPKNND